MLHERQSKHPVLNELLCWKPRRACGGHKDDFCLHQLGSRCHRIRVQFSSPWPQAVSSCYCHYLSFINGISQGHCTRISDSLTSVLCWNAAKPMLDAITQIIKDFMSLCRKLIIICGTSFIIYISCSKQTTVDMHVTKYIWIVD